MNRPLREGMCQMRPLGMCAWLVDLKGRVKYDRVNGKKEKGNGKEKQAMEKQKTEKLRMAVIGAGFIGQKYIEVIHRLANAELAAVCDIDEGKLEAAGSKYGCGVYTDYGEMYEKEGLDAVAICVSEPYHLGPAVAAAEAGLAIMIEKPIAQNLEEALKIKEAVDRNGVRMMVAQLCEFDSRYYYTAQAVHEGKLGDVTSIYVKRSSTRALAEGYGGRISIFHFMGAHDIDAMLWFAQPALPVKAYSQWSSIKNKDLGAPDTVFSTFTFDNGIVAAVQLCWALPSENPALGFVVSGEVVGTKGVSYINIKDQGVEIFSETGVSYPDVSYWPEYLGTVHGKIREEVEHFVDRTLSGEGYLVDTDRAIEVVRATDACHESLRLGQAVDIAR